MNLRGFWDGLEKIHNLTSLSEDMKNFFQGLTDATEKIRLTPPAEEQKMLDDARQVIGHVCLAESLTHPLFVDYITETRKPPISKKGEKRRTRFGENEVVSSIKNLAILQSKIEETNLDEYKVRVAEALDWIEQVLMACPVSQGQVDYTKLETILDIGLPDRLHDTLRDILHRVGYEADLVDPYLDKVLAKPMQNIESKVTAWSDGKVAAAKDNRPGWRKIIEFWKD